ncbi:division/cell wall cluster transcriptional repressor MraZ [Calidifontibacter sp. DB0510]|uniref:Transcriptional regulator MraZ n=1 Tax=Metallococcus carri TaxID=1656884 RepID=A0A967E969_9MICO|nr:division/cell wall cluster transcriptional repressor MraZ [Metallococcus carri]NHN56042.1 division/cell wall cluster transcriptional repressor MraZ [Metallococcus carri]NOP37501.1 division/cell wall cluster transcriptional repressor MraZ [Calidifontibacter sp. DB2511S]
MFLGTHQPRLDDKGRLFLPAKFREKLAGGLVMTRGHERCLFVYPVADFERIVAEMSTTPTSNKAVRNFQRVLLSGASDEIPDKQGRVTIPALLREYAGLTRECVVLGVGNRLEIWDAEAWAAQLAASEDDYADTEQEVIPGGSF